MQGRLVFINFAAMKTLGVVLLALSLLCSCGRKPVGGRVFTVETMNGITPVKRQGGGSAGWVYAMLAVIESDRIMQGDSVNLSPAYIVRSMLERQAERCYLSAGADSVGLRGTALGLLDALEEYGAMPYDSYRSDCNYGVLCRKLSRLANAAAVHRTGLERLRRSVADVLDNDVNPLPRRVWMYGAEYTTREFAHSICLPGDYVAMTSYTHEPFGESVALCLPADGMGHKYLNLPLDTLVNRVVCALRSGRSVCWEGGVKGGGFSFERGIADTIEGKERVTQAVRQRAFESLAVTCDHAMAIVGLARDASGGLWFICKDSRCTANPQGGLVDMSEQYFRLNTVAVVMKDQSR